MNDWSARARLHLSQRASKVTDETDNAPISSALSVHVGNLSKIHESVNDATERLSASPLEPPVRCSGKMVEGIANGPDRLCYPHSDAMNTSEIERFIARVSRFTSKGLIRYGAEALADKLVGRDRFCEDLRSCFECQHFEGHRQSNWRCCNWDIAGIAIRSQDARLPADLVIQLQRCDGFISNQMDQKKEREANEPG